MFISFLIKQRCRNIYIFKRQKAMSLFFHQQESRYTLRGTENWLSIGNASRECAVKGVFFERHHGGVVNSIEMNSDDQYLFFYQNQNIKAVELNLAVLEDQFYYNQSHRVYEIKLKKGNLLTIIFTQNFQTFIKFYKHLAKYTILKCFEKHYRLLKFIGRGSSSNVYLGQNIFSKQQVALKIFQKKNTQCIKQLTATIINQILNLEKLRKFRLSPLIGVYQTSDCIIIVMQKAEAGNMLNYLQLHVQDYNQQLIKTIIFKVLQNLKQLHIAGFIHRDVKPENILFSSYSTNSGLFLGDFGCSVMKKDSNTSKIGRTCSGTLGFIAPEIIKSEVYDQKCDLFSVGCLLYFLLKGQCLFNKKTANEIYQMISDEQIIKRKVNLLQNLNILCKNLLLKLLKINPEERISAQEALNDQFFKNLCCKATAVGQQNYSLEEYLRKKAQKFFQ